MFTPNMFEDRIHLIDVGIVEGYDEKHYVSTGTEYDLALYEDVALLLKDCTVFTLDDGATWRVYIISK